MKIKFVNHASFIIEYGSTSLLSDLWLSGDIFNKSWRLVSPSFFGYEDFDSIDFIWFSHEHPDHFSPSDLKKIEEDRKENIQILFQSTIDKRVTDFCNYAGFKKINELHPGRYFKLQENFEVLCEAATEGDSWICYKVGGYTILNTNDCAIRTVSDAYSILNRLDSDIDILLTKFSYASWSGNPNQTKLRKDIASKKLSLLDLQVKVFKPKVTIPIASYFFFCHEENFYLNDYLNSPECVYSFLKKQGDTIPVILYPGDTYDLELNYNSDKAINKYRCDYGKIYSGYYKSSLVKNVTIPLEEIESAAVDYFTFLKSIQSRFNFLSAFIKEFSIYLWDYDKSYIFSLERGILALNIPEKDCDVAMSSESMLFCFTYPYGFETVRIGGRLHRPIKGNYAKFYNFFRPKMLIDKREDMRPEFFKPIF